MKKTKEKKCPICNFFKQNAEKTRRLYCMCKEKVGHKSNS